MCVLPSDDRALAGFVTLLVFVTSLGGVLFTRHARSAAQRIL
jgi:hypothetical protein